MTIGAGQIVPSCVLPYDNLSKLLTCRRASLCGELDAYREVQVVMVSRGTVEENRRMAGEQGFDFPVLVWDDAVAREYAVPGTPFFYVVDEEGVIVNKGFGNTQAQLEALARGGAE